MKLARRVLPRLVQQGALVEGRPDRICRPGHDRQMSEADLAVSQGLHRVLELADKLSDGNPISRAGAGHVAVDADPVDRTDETIRFVVVGSRKSGRLLRERQLHQVDDMTLTDEPLPTVVSGQLCSTESANVLRREHKTMLQTYVRQVNTLGQLICLGRPLTARPQHEWPSSNSNFPELPSGPPPTPSHSCVLTLTTCPTAALLRRPSP